MRITKKYLFKNLKGNDYDSFLKQKIGGLTHCIIYYLILKELTSGSTMKRSANKDDDGKKSSWELNWGKSACHYRKWGAFRASPSY